MAKFIYNFEQILNVKQKLERQEQTKLGIAMQNLSAAMQQLEVMNRRYAYAIKAFQEELSSGGINPLQVKTLNEKVKYFHQQVGVCQDEVKNRQELVDKAKEKLQEALRERKTYEILKEKAYEVYLEEEKANEAKQIDEIVSFKYKDER